MNCPYCGSEVRENEKFCQSCGAALAQTDEAAPPAPIQEAAPSAETPAFTAQQAPREMSFREFIESPSCTPDVNKTIKTGWIILFVCAGISAVAQIVSGALPIDGILMAGIAFWLMKSKSFAAGVTACAVGVLELILTSITMGQLAGWLPAIAGVYALTAVLKARKQYKAYLASQQSAK